MHILCLVPLLKNAVINVFLNHHLLMHEDAKIILINHRVNKKCFH